MALAIALDLGTTSISAVALRVDGTVATHVRVANDAGVSALPTGHSEQKPQRLRELAWKALAQLADQIDETPACLGLTGQMHGVLLLDADQQPLGNLITWQDRRAILPCSEGTTTYLETLLGTVSEAALTRTGCRLAGGYLGTTLYVLGRLGAIPPNLAKVSFLADWMAAELTGSQISTDPSNAASSGVYDLQRGCWSEELPQATGIAPRWLPAVRESGMPVGRLTPRAAAETGLPQGLPVCNAIGDNQAAVLGSVPAGDPAIQINVGTGGQINWPIPRFERSAGMDTRSLPLGRYMLVGAGVTGGDAYAWVNRTVAGWLEAFGLHLTNDEIYARVNTLAANLTGTEGLSCTPFFRGTRRRPEARGEFNGIRFDNFTLGHVARAVIEGVARGLYSFYEAAGSAQPAQLSRIVGSGNGLRKNPLLVDTLERIFERTIWFPVHEEEAAYGAALLAGVQTGLWPNLETAGKQIQLIPAHRNRATDATLNE